MQLPCGESTQRASVVSALTGDKGRGGGRGGRAETGVDTTPRLCSCLRPAKPRPDTLGPRGTSSSGPAPPGIAAVPSQPRLQAVRVPRWVYDAPRGQPSAVGRDSP